MARTKKNVLLKNVSGTINKQIVVKQYGDKTVITSYPDMSRVKQTALQKLSNKRFKEAVAYAKKINRDKEMKEQYRKKYKLKKGESVYHAALSEFMKRKPWIFVCEPKSLEMLFWVTDSE